MDKVDLECPRCNKKVQVSFDDVARQRTVRCPLGHWIKLKDEKGGARKVSTAVEDFDKQLERLGEES